MPITEEVRARILELARGGVSCNGIAREVGVSPSTVSRAANKAGISFDRSQTATAVQAATIDAAERRAQIGAALLEDLNEARTIRLPRADDPRGFQQVAGGMAALARAYSDLIRLPEPEKNNWAELKEAILQLNREFMAPDTGYGRPDHILPELEAGELSPVADDDPMQ